MTHSTLEPQPLCLSAMEYFGITSLSQDERMGRGGRERLDYHRRRMEQRLAAETVTTHPADPGDGRRYVSSAPSSARRRCG